MLDDDELLFQDEDEEESELFADDEENGSDLQTDSTSDIPLNTHFVPSRYWKVLIVDDDEEIHFITKLALKDFVFDGKNLEFVSAFSGEEAKRIIQENPDTALILLDVVMEDDEAGLKVVKFIRNDLNNYTSRIVLRTGQPGQAPENHVIIEYDINDYKTKTELTAQKLVSTIVTALRSYRDIVKKIEAQGQLGDKTRQLEEERNIFISGPVAIFKWSYEEGYPVKYASPNVSELFGYSVENFTSGEISYLDMIHQDDRIKVVNDIEMYNSSYRESFQHEYRINTADGRVLWVNHYSKLVRDEDGEVTGFFGYIIDATKNKETELLFFENAAEGIVVLDTDHKVTKANKAISEMVGVGVAEMQGRPISSFFDEDNGQIVQHMIGLLDTKAEVHRFEVYLERPDEEQVPCLFNPNLLCDLSGKVLGILAFVIDLTERKKMEDDLKKAMQAEKRFIATMSHEIRTPLTSILGFVDLLRDTELGDGQKELVQNISVSSHHLLSLINSILDVSKVEAGQLELTQEEINIEEVLSECGIIVSNRVKEDVKLIIDIPEFDYYVYGDQLRIKQLFVNLLGNATKFTDHGHIKLYLAHCDEQADGYIHLNVCVEDTGAGIPEEKKGHLFQPFKQAHSSKYGGTGLGLYLAKAFAKLMSGDIELESEAGVGTSFFVHMRLKKGSAKESRLNMQGKRILYVEDEQFLEKKMQEKFTHIGAEVIGTAQKGSVLEIAKIVEGQHLDSAIIDIDFMKDKSDYLANILIEMFPNLPILGIKSDSSVYQPSTIKSLLPAPFTFHQLASRLDSMMTQEKDEENYDFSKLNVLLAEDVLINQQLAKKLFKKFFNMTIDTCDDGLQAVEKVKSNSYDVVFMDMNMPNMSGTEAVEEIRKFNQDLHIIALTANAYAEDIERAYASGMNDYCTKPFEKRKIQKALLNMLENQGMSAQPTSPAPDPQPADVPAAPQESASTTPEVPVTEPSSTETTHTPETSAPDVDLKALALKNLASELGDQEEAEAIMPDLVEQAQSIMSEIEANMQSQDKTTLTRAFHSLKGMLLSIKLNDQADIAKELEMMGREDQSFDVIEPKKQELFTALRSLVE